jgi:hypothetical protein
MQRIDRDTARHRLELWRQAGHHVDSRLLREIDREGELFLLRLEDDACFLSLIWQESDPARLLTPGGTPRTLRDVVLRFRQAEYTFESLTQPRGLPREQHHPEWFRPCVEIDRGFDFDKFGWVALVAANDGERSQSPHGTFYLYDGTHKTLVLAKRLLAGETAYQPIDALYLVPRRG